MPKQVVASVKIIHNGEEFQVGKPLDTSKFTKEDLTRLYERGAVKIMDSSEVYKQQDGTLADVPDTEMAGAPSVPSAEDEQKAETKRAEAKDQLREQQTDPNATEK